MRKFPLTDTDSLGQFMLVGSAGDRKGEVVTGVLRLKETRVTLEVSPQLTPVTQMSEVRPGVAVRQPRSDEPRDFAVLGSLAISPRLVTLWGTNIMRTSTVGFAPPGEAESGNQEMSVRWCLVGDALPDDETLFDATLLDITNLHDWTGSSYTGRSAPFPVGDLPQTWALDLPKHEPAPLKHTAGDIKLVAEAVSSAPSNDGFKVTTNTRVKITLGSGGSVDTYVSGFALPLASLMTILSGSESTVRRIELRREDELPVGVYGRGVDMNAPKSSGALLLRRGNVEEDLLSNWLAAAEELAPVPRILASVWAGSIPAVETEYLTLATTAEALHRLIHPDARRFTTGEIEDAVSALEEADMSAKLKESLTGALSKHWHEKSYPQRIEALATPVAEAVPSCIGSLSKWKAAVVKARHELAHGATGVTDDPEKIFRLATLTRSLRWMLTFRLLLHCGVSPEELRTATERSDRYKKDVRQWQHFWTKIYPAERE